MQDKISKILQSSIDIKREILANDKILKNIEQVVNAAIACFKQGGKVLTCGNGGSAADAQHLSAELSGRFYKDRNPLFAEALHVNTSYLTAVANDYSFDEVYARLVKAKGKNGDILWGFSTSGNSENILRAFIQAKASDMITVGFTGESGGKLAPLCDILINVPSTDTPRIQECHIVIGHIICELIEDNLF